MKTMTIRCGEIRNRLRVRWMVDGGGGGGGSEVTLAAPGERYI